MVPQDKDIITSCIIAAHKDSYKNPKDTVEKITLLIVSLFFKIRCICLMPKCVSA